MRCDAEQSEQWRAKSDKIIKESEKENGHEDEIPLLLEELQEEADYTVQNIDKLFKKEFAAFRREKNEILEQHESDKKIWISAMVKYRAEFRSFYANLVHHLRKNGYTGPIPEFPKIAIKTIVEDVRKTIRENRAGESLAEPLQNLSLVPPVPVSVNAPAPAPSTSNQFNVEVSGNSNYTRESKYEWRWSADADEDDWRN